MLLVHNTVSLCEVPRLYKTEFSPSRQNRPAARASITPRSTVEGQFAAQDVSSFAQGLPVPKPWRWQANPLGQTVWTVRLETASQRGSYLSDPTSGVLIGLVSKDGHSLLHRVSALQDPAEIEYELKRILQAAVEESWAKHEIPQGSPQVAHRRPGDPGKLRFQESSIDEVSFLGPELGTLAGLMLGTESGRWKCGEVTVSSSRSWRANGGVHADRFLCHDWIGRGHSSAVYLKPVPADQIVYGSVLITNEQSVKLHAMGMRRYEDLKERLLNFTAGLTISGAILTGAIGGPEMAYPFALGGSASFMYLRLLQKGVDALPGGMGYSLPAGLVNRYKGLMGLRPGGMVDLLPDSSAKADPPSPPSGTEWLQDSGHSTTAQQVQKLSFNQMMAASSIWSMGDSKPEDPDHDPQQSARQVSYNLMMRFAAVSALCFGIVVGVHQLEPLRGVHTQAQQIRTLVAGFMGFMMFKVAVLGVAAMPVAGDAQPLQRRL